MATPSLSQLQHAGVDTPSRAQRAVSWMSKAVSWLNAPYAGGSHFGSGFRGWAKAIGAGAAKTVGYIGYQAAKATCITTAFLIVTLVRALLALVSLAIYPFVKTEHCHTEGPLPIHVSTWDKLTMYDNILEGISGALFGMYNIELRL